MRRSGPPKRRTPLQSHSTLKRSTAPMTPMSKKRRGLLSQRERVRAEVLERDGGVCRVRALGLEPVFGPCWGGLEVDEVKSRSRGGDWLDADGAQVLCHFHNSDKGSGTVEYERYGLAKRSWED